MAKPQTKTQKCSACKQDKPANSVCANCIEISKAKRKARLSKSAPKYRQSIRQQMINAYGDACACCGETEPHFLAVDHINNDGAAHRRAGGYTGTAMYLWLRRNGFPKDRFQLLCHNCNVAKGLYGVCPHKKLRQTTRASV